MLNIRKTALAVLALSLGSSAAVAGTMGPACVPGSVTIPCERTAWNFGAGAIYLQPTVNSTFGYLGYDAVGGIEIDPPFIFFDGLDKRLNDFNPQWGWGFKIEGSYHYNRGDDINLNWYHINNSTHRDRDFDFTFFLVNVEDLFTLETSNNPKWDAVNLEFGKHMDFDETKSVRFHAGVQYSHIEMNTNLRLDDVPDFFERFNLNNDMKFNGFGPRIGADFNYMLGNNFSIYGNGAAGLLVGTSSFNNGIFFDEDLIIGNNGSRTTVVPELELKIGAKYVYVAAQGDFTLDAGYMWVDYLGEPLHSGLGAFGVALARGTDFALNGPYIELKWEGNVL
jgi:hypothetical protein